MEKTINIGITVSAENYQTSNFFSNGIKQNVITLRETYENCKNVNKSYIINTHSQASNTSNKNTAWEEYGQYIISKEEAEEKCDLIVVCQGSLHLHEYEKYKKLGKKIVKQILGPEFSIFVERNLFNVPAGGIYKRNDMVDAVWISPHYFNRDRHFFQTIFSNAEIYEAPYIWDHRFLNTHLKILIESRKNFSGLYVPSGQKQKRISTMEPNLNTIKTCATPLIIAELLERKYPEYLRFYSVFGGENIKNKKDMIDFALNLNINKSKKCFFESRYPIVWTLNDHTDIVLSHQNQNELNYLYLDAAWLGFPVVHNSPMMKELGWYYPENDAEKAVEQIKYIAENFDVLDHPDEKYLKKSREFASQYFPSSEKNIKGYEDLIKKVYR